MVKEEQKSQHKCSCALYATKTKSNSFPILFSSNVKDILLQSKKNVAYIKKHTCIWRLTLQIIERSEVNINTFHVIVLWQLKLFHYSLYEANIICKKEYQSILSNQSISFEWCDCHVNISKWWPTARTPPTQNVVILLNEFHWPLHNISKVTDWLLQCANRYEQAKLEGHKVLPSGSLHYVDWVYCSINDTLLINDSER